MQFKPREHALYLTSLALITAGILTEFLVTHYRGSTHWEKSVTAATATFLPIAIWYGIYRCGVKWLELDADAARTRVMHYRPSKISSRLELQVEKSFSQPQRLFLGVGSFLCGAALTVLGINDTTNNKFDIASSSSAAPYLMSTNLFLWVGPSLLVVGMGLIWAYLKNRPSARDVGTNVIQNPFSNAAVVDYGSRNG